MFLKIAALAIFYIMTYHLYRRTLPRIRRRLGVALGKLNEITITLGVGKLSQVIVFALAASLTYFIQTHQEWPPWQPIFQGNRSPSTILSDNVPTLLTILVFITTSTANAVRDRKQGGTYFKEYLSSYLNYRSITSDIIWTPIFNVLVFAFLALPLILELFDTKDPLILGWIAVDIHKLMLSLWISTLTVVSTVLLFNFLSLLQHSMIHLFQPNQIMNEIRMDVDIDASSEIRSIISSRENDKSSLSSTFNNNCIEFWLSLPNKKEQDEYFMVTVSSREWVHQQSIISRMMQYRTLREEEVWSWSYLKHPSLWPSLIWPRAQENKLESFDQIMRGRHNAFVGSIKSDISVAHREILLRQMCIDSRRMNEFIRSTGALSTPCDNQRDMMFRQIGLLSKAHQLPQSNPDGIVKGIIAPFFFKDEQRGDSPWVITLSAITYREIARTIKNGYSSDNPLSQRYSITSLRYVLDSANSICHEPTQRYALHCLIESLIDSLIINRHPSEQILASELEMLVPGLYSYLNPPLLETSSGNSKIPNPPAVDIIIGCIKSQLKPIGLLSPEAYSELLKYVHEEEAAAALLYMLLYTSRSGRKVSPEILRPFASALRNHRIVSDDNLKVFYEAASTVLNRSSCVSHTLNESGLKWLFEILDTPITATLYCDLTNRETSRYIDLNFTNLVLWRTLVGDRIYCGRYFIDSKQKSLEEWDIKNARRGAENAAEILESAGMEYEARNIRSSLPTEESAEEQQLQKPRRAPSKHPFPHFHSRPTPGADRRLSNRQRRRLSRPSH